MYALASYKSYPFPASLSSSLVAEVFSKVISHQWSLSITFKILLLTNSITILFLLWTWYWKVRVSFFCNIYTFRDTQCCSTDCLLMHRCQLYIFRTVTVHPQELLFRCCMCTLWYVLIRPAGTMFEEELLPQTLYLRDVSDSAVRTTYHSLHIEHLKRSSWGWTVTFRNM